MTLTPEVQTLMDETSAAIRRGEMYPPKVPWWWEPRREGEMTPEYLGRVLEATGLPDLARRAREGHFDDFHAPEDVADGLELVHLVVELREEAKRVADPAGRPYSVATIDLRRERIAAIENAIRHGEFDATKAESDRWAASKNAQDTFAELLADMRRSRRGNRYAPPPPDPRRRPVVPDDKPGRNDPCSCGSGKKWKRCHGA